MQAVSDAFSVYQLRHGFSTDLDESWHGQSVEVREGAYGVRIFNFGTVAMEIWKCEV